MPLFDHFGILAPYYDRVISLREPERLIRRIGLPVEGSLLDVGGGTGRIARALNGLASQLILIDESLRMLQQAQGNSGLGTICSYSESLPFPAGSFERVIMVDVMHHVAHQQKTAAELWRVLKPGGRLVIEEPDIAFFAVKLVALAEKLALMRSHFLSPERIRELFPYPEAQVRIEREQYNAWIMIDKSPQADGEAT